MKLDSNHMFLLLATFSVINLVQAQNQTGFISLNCGATDQTITDTETKLTYTSDTSYVNGGTSPNWIQTQYHLQFHTQMWSLRSFPEGIRNCYQFNLTKDHRYLIKASFLYGDYDGHAMLPSFDVYLGPNLWSQVKITNASTDIRLEITHVLTSNRLQICLVKNGTTIPFINLLEIRPLPSDIYQTQSESLLTLWRNYLSNEVNQDPDESIRFDKDIYDRKWTSDFRNEWTGISADSNSNINTSNPFNPPQLAMRNAATPKNGTQPLNYTIYADNTTGNKLYVYLHFAELEILQSNQSRQFNITFNGGRGDNGGIPEEPFTPSYLSASSPIFSMTALESFDGKFDFVLQKTETSTHPPLLNAIEVYRAIQFSQLETNSDEVDAIMNVKAIYEVNRIRWQGDPCAPELYLWDGLKCNYSVGSPRIISLTLSSSGLTGDIAPYISNLTQLENLDLSNNHLTGEVPPFLAQLKFLKFLNLSSNQLNGPIPSGLLEKQKQGLLTFSFGGNPILCKTYSCNVKKHSILVPVVTVVAVLIVIAVAFSSFLIIRRRRNSINQVAKPPPPPLLPLPLRAELSPGKNYVNPVSRIPLQSVLETKGRWFSYSEIVKITNNFEKVLGKGGYGIVYHGYLDGIQVAVKMLSESSAQGYKEFKTEVELLLRVHHKNLVSLVGYCDEGDNMSLIYEFMANGDLKEYLSGKRGNNTLNWKEKLQIAAEAAQGLEYLHHGCKPPIVHRDVKTTNILLDQHFQAKLGDFGISKSFSADRGTRVSTLVAGTPGYLDPEYFKTNFVTEKLDLYSFGVALMEIIVNQPVIDNTREMPHIIEWVSMVLAKGDIKSIIDPKLEGDYDTNNAWKAIELAMSCVNPTASRRPTMTYVAAELNECLAAETARKEGRQKMESMNSIEVILPFGNAYGPGASNFISGNDANSHLFRLWVYDHITKFVCNIYK